jgi:regulator of protease activity HflC (stomatin/prohibitin superfamily)
MMENPPAYLTALICVYGLFLILIVASLAASIRVVREDKRLSVYRFGRYLGEKGPGLVLLIPFVDKGVMRELGNGENTPSQRLVGAVGETRTTVFTSGKVFLGDEEWDAVSQSVISAGRRVRVVKMILEVEEE